MGALALVVVTVAGAQLSSSSGADVPGTSVAHTSPGSASPTTLRLALSGPGREAVPGATLRAMATVSTPGTVTFTENGSAIRGCVGVPAPSTTATCTFPAPGSGQLRVVAELAPYGPDLQSSSQGLTITVVPRTQSRRVGPFAVGSAQLTKGVSATVAAAARVVRADGYTVVWAVGHDRAGPADEGRSVERARTVAAALAKDLASLEDHKVRILVRAGVAGYPSVTVTMGF